MACQLKAESLRAFELAGSTQLTEDIEKKALEFMDMTMLKSLWEEI